MSAPDVAGILAALARLPGTPPERARALVVSLDAVRSARALHDGRRMPAPRQRAYSPSLAAYAAARRRDRRGRFVAVALVAMLLALAGCGSSSTAARDGAEPPAPIESTISYVPGRVTGLQHAPCRAQGDGEDALPDPVCTPGAVGEVKVDLVCTPRFQAQHRVDVTRAKVAAMAAYGVPLGTVVEYDHRVPLSLGGANDVLNLWPQPSERVGKSGVRNAKDGIEYSAWYAVCRSHTAALADAQRAFMGDWRNALRVLKVRAVSPPPGEITECAECPR